MKCTQCSREAEDAHYKMCERCREYQHKRYIQNPKKYCDLARKRREANPENSRMACRKWHVANREFSNMLTKQWKQAHPENNRINENNRRARKEGNGGALPKDIGKILFDAQDGFCYLCGELLYGKFNDLVCIEHMTPISRGGRNDLTNVGLAHLSCNTKKFTRTYEEFLNMVHKE